MTSSPPSIGRPLLRDEDPALLTGRARYTADIGPGVDPLPAGERFWVVYVRSTMAHAELGPIDTAHALSAPGVVAVVTAADLDVFPAGRFAPPIHSVFAQPLLAEKRARYVGEPVAAIVATSIEAGTDAAELVEVDYRPLRAVIDLDDALAGDTPLFDASSAPRLAAGAPPEEPHEGGNVAVTVEPVGSDVSGRSVFDDADVLIERRQLNPRMSPAPIETRAASCWWDGDRLFVLAATQRPHGHRSELARLYDLDEDRIVVIAPAVGGGFGGKPSRSPEERLLPFLARSVGRPVTWVETRSEYLAAATQARGERFDIALAGSREGRIEGLRIDMVKDCGAYPITGAVLPAAYTALNASGPYDVAQVEFAARCVATNCAPTSAFRGAGRGPYIAALERVIDEYAAEIDIDPAEVRRRNLIRPEQMPYPTPTGAIYDEADYPADLERALTMIGYEERRAEQATRNADGSHRRLGIGIGCYNHMTVGGGGEEASVTILDDGRARVITGTTSQGHGHTVTWAQVAADVLAMPVADIEVVEGRTDIIGSGVGAVGSRSLQTAGVAIHRSASEVVERARDLAADLLEAAADDIVLDEALGRFHVIGTPARSLGWADIAAALPAETVEDAAGAVPDSGPGSGSGRPTELSCGELYDNEGRNTFPSGAHVAVVEVDVETGAVDVVRYVGVDDAGVVVNPMIVEGQLHGGIASGIGQVLGESIRYDGDGNLRTATFVDYGLPTADELPSFEISLAEVPTSFNELGVKGVGESGTIGATPAVHNAIVDALIPLGVTHIELPCTAERVWAAITDAAGSAAPNFES